MLLDFSFVAYSVVKKLIFGILVLDIKDVVVLIRFFTFSVVPIGAENLGDLKLVDWLKDLNLTEYESNFESNFFTSMEKVSGIWDDELTSILDITKLGHRKRILLSLAGPEGNDNCSRASGFLFSFDRLH